MSESNALRVLYISNSIAMGGMEIHMLDLARAMVARGNSVMAVVPTLSELDSQVSRLAEAGVRVERLNIDGAQSFTQLVQAWMQLRRWVVEFKPDVVHQHRTGPFHGKWAVLAACSAGARTIVATEHQPAYRLSGARRWINRIVDVFVDKIIAVSEADRTQQIEMTDRPANRIVAIHNGIDIRKFALPSREELALRRQELDIPEDALLIGTLARLVPQKGIAYLFSALSKLPGNWVALIAGDGPLRQDLEQQAKQLGIDPRVRFLGFCAEPAHVLSTFDVFVLPSEWESFGLAPVEAMAMGKPVILSRVGGMSELVIDGESGIYVAPGDVMALASALDLVLNDAILRDLLGRAARARVEKLFSLETMAEKTQSLYCSLIQNKSRATEKYSYTRS
jgi:glycosyltransferase involved in cell wall biosynthesis